MATESTFETGSEVINRLIAASLIGPNCRRVIIDLRCDSLSTMYAVHYGDKDVHKIVCDAMCEITPPATDAAKGLPECPVCGGSGGTTMGEDICSCCGRTRIADVCDVQSKPSDAVEGPPQRADFNTRRTPLTALFLSARARTMLRTWSVKTIGQVLDLRLNGTPLSRFEGAPQEVCQEIEMAVDNYRKGYDPSLPSGAGRSQVEADATLGGDQVQHGAFGGGCKNCAKPMTDPEARLSGYCAECYASHANPDPNKGE